MSRTKILISIVALALAFSFGYYVTPTKTVEVIKTVEVEKKVSESEINKHKKTVTHEFDNKDGSKSIVTVVTEDSDKKKEVTDDKTIQTTDQKTVTRNGSKLSVAILAGTKISLSGDLFKDASYGAHVSKEILGPVTIGIWGLSSGVGGVSAGLNF